MTTPEALASPAALRVEGLCVDLPRRDGLPRPLLHDIGFALQRHEVLGVLGESGAGKSLLARALCAALEAPLVARGVVAFDGVDLIGRPRAAMAGLWGQRLAYVGADPTRHFDPTLPVGAQIAEKLRAVEPGLGRAEARERVLALLDEVRIPQAAARYGDLPQHYSGGMIQRAAIADALISDPEVLVADSILQPLDTTVAAQVLRLLHALRARRRTAIVFLSASPALIAEACSRVLVLAGGRAVEAGPTAEVFAGPRHLATRQLLADVPRVWTADPLPRRSTPAAGAPLLEVEALEKRYRQRGAQAGTVHAVRGVSLTLRRGEHLGIVGESGCGKSTLSRLLAGLEAPDGGHVRFDGVEPSRLPRKAAKALRRRFQLVLPDPFQALPAHWPIGRIVAEPLRIHGLAGPGERAAVTAALEEVGLPRDWYERLPGGLSAGQRQRVNLARALVLAPELLVLDETLSALDATEQRQLLALLDRLQRERGLTTIFISHDLAMLRRICNRIAVMYLGRLVEVGPAEATYRAPLHPYTRALLAALPVLEPNPFRREACLLDGETPSPIDIPRGCSFASRCPQAMARCLDEDPGSRTASERAAACHLLDGSA